MPAGREKPPGRTTTKQPSGETPRGKTGRVPRDNVNREHPSTRAAVRRDGKAAAEDLREKVDHRRARATHSGRASPDRADRRGNHLLKAGNSKAERGRARRAERQCQAVNRLGIPAIPKRAAKARIRGSEATRHSRRPRRAAANRSTDRSRTTKQDRRAASSDRLVARLSQIVTPRTRERSERARLLMTRRNRPTTNRPGRKTSRRKPWRGATRSVPLSNRLRRRYRLRRLTTLRPHLPAPHSVFCWE